MARRRKKPKTREVGRRADNGRFIPVSEARRRKKTAIVQRIPVGRR